MSEASRERLWHILYPHKTYKPKGSPVPNPNPNDTITRAELARELTLRVAGVTPPTFRGYTSVNEVVNAVVDAVNPPKVQPVPNESLTFPELCDALRRLGYADFTTEQHARRICNDIIDHREPVWHDGVVVKDADGVIWRNRFGSWLQFGSTTAFAPDVPKRPLKKIGSTVAEKEEGR